MMLNAEVTLQRNIANAILKELEVLDPYVIIAGGAPRNWADQLPAKDLDIYIHFKPQGMEHAQKLVSVLTGVVTAINGKTYEDNRGVISMVLDGEYLGIKVQFIFVNTSVHNTLDHFIVENSKTYYKGGRINCGGLARMANHLKEIWVNAPFESLTPQQVKYVSKIQGYYPDYLTIYVPDIPASMERYFASFAIGEVHGVG